MPTPQKVETRGRKKKQTPLLECSAIPSKVKRGRKPLYPPPQHGATPVPFSFFKVLIGNFKDVLFIPPMAAFTLNSLAEKYVYLEDATGKFWNIKMSVIDGSLAFYNGWHDFISDHSITTGEFVIFTYTGGLLFTVRIFGLSAMERVAFQLKKKRGRCSRESCTAELKLDNVLFNERYKASKAPKEENNPSGAEVLKSLKKRKGRAKCDVFKVIENDSISERAQKIPKVTEIYINDLNYKESENNIVYDSEQTHHRNSCVTVEGLSAVSPTVLAKSGVDNLEAITCKSLRNGTSITEEGAVLLHSYEGLLTYRTDENSDAMTKSASWIVKAHSDINEGSIEMSCSQVQMNEAHDKIINPEKIEQADSHDLEIIDSESYDDETASLSQHKHADCNLKLDFDLIEPELIADKVFLSENGICYTSLDEKSAEHAIGTFLDVNEQKEPIDQNDHATNDKDNLMLINEEYGVHHTNGSQSLIKSSLRSSTKARVRNKRSLVKNNETDLVAIPSSSYLSFEVCLSDDVQSFIELPKKLVGQISKLKYDRKIVVLQDLSMRCWPVLYHQTLKFVGFIGGWIDFVRANNICQGDTCKFELVNKMEPIFHVNVMKAEVSTFDEKESSP